MIFLTAIDPKSRSVVNRLEMTHPPETDNNYLPFTEFVSRVVTRITTVREQDIPTFAPLATPGINPLIFRQGESFQTRRRIPVSVTVEFFGPYSSGNRGHLPKGVKFQVASEGADFTRATHCEMLEPYYSGLEKKLVKRRDLNHPKYGGYSVSIDSGVIDRHCVSIPNPREKGEADS